jgi:hypothetical protein
MTVVSGAGRVSHPLGIRAPDPRSVISDQIKKGSKVEIRPGEPVFMFIPSRVGAGTKLEGLNRNSPFSVTRVAKPPVGVPVPRTPGSWVRISLKLGEEAGQKDQVKLVARSVTPSHSTSKVVSFTLVAGHQRYY